MRRSTFAALTAALIIRTGPVLAQPAGAPAMSALSGTCESLIVGGQDMTPICGTKVLNLTYANGRTALWFILQNGGMFSFSGSQKPKMDGKGSATHAIDGVMFGVKPNTDPAMARASGRCITGNPFQGPMRIVCEAKSEQGRMRAVFASDGQPPQ